MRDIAIASGPYRCPMTNFGPNELFDSNYERSLSKHTHSHSHTHTHTHSHSHTHTLIHTVSFLKRAQIFPADVWHRFGGCGFGEFNNIHTLTMFADYR